MNIGIRLGGGEVLSSKNIDQDAIEEYLDYLKHERLSSSTIVTRTGDLNTFFNYMKEHEDIEDM